MNNTYSADEINVVDLRTKSLTEALLEIERKPFLWLHKLDVFNLHSFLSGWIAGRRNIHDEEFLQNFDKFVVHEFSEGASTAGWANIIAKHSEDEDNLKLFFKLLKKFLEVDKD